MIPIVYQLLQTVLSIVILVLIIHVVLSWLIGFQMISMSHPFVRSLWQFTSRVTEPLARPFRRLIPPVAGFDLSIAVVLFVLFFVQSSILPWLFGMLVGSRTFLN